MFGGGACSGGGEGGVGGVGGVEHEFKERSWQVDISSATEVVVIKHMMSDELACDERE